MTPLMLSPGAAPAASSGPIDHSDALPSAPQGAPGGARSGALDAGFDATLTSVLDDDVTSSSEAADASDQVAGQSGAANDASFMALWLQALGGNAAKGSDAALEETEQAATPDDQTETTDIDEDAAIAAALAMVMCQPGQARPSAKGTAVVPAQGDATGSPAPAPVSAPTPAAMPPGPNSVAGESLVPVVATDAVSGAAGVHVAADATAAEDEPGVSEPVPAEAPRHAEREAHLAARLGNPYHAAAHPGVAVQAKVETPPPAVPSSTDKATGDTATVPDGSQSAPPAAGKELSAAHRALADAPLTAAVSNEEAQTQSNMGERSRDQGRGEQRAAPTDAGWLRRSSSLESKLTPPPSFGVPVTLSTAAPVAAQVNATTGHFQIPQPAENLSRLVQSMRVQARDGVSEASVRLNPEHLGEVTIAIRIDAGTVTAVVRAEAGDVRQWLRGQEDSIRQALAEQGLTLDEFVVEQDGHGQQDRGQEPESRQRRQRGRSQATSTSSFEVTA